MEKKENRNSYSELSKGSGEEPSPSKTLKKEPRKAKENREIRILRKSKSIKEKHDPSRFSGEGINFKAKIIGIEDVFDARGNRMCQEALSKLKAAVKTSGDHKQKIVLNISLQGIIIKDEKSGEVLHHHPIHKISCISQDTKDNRAFGFVYGCPKTGHRFFAIKTEKAASQVVMTLRDLFLVALEIKKKEIEDAFEKDSGMESEAGKGSGEPEQNNKVEKEAAVAEAKPVNGLSNGVEPDIFPADFHKPVVQKFNTELLYSNTVLLPEEEMVPAKSESNVAAAAATATVPEMGMGSLFDLQSEVSNLQQGITQMDRSIAHNVSQNLGISFSEDEISEASSCSIPTFQFKMDKLSSLYHETMSISSRSSTTSDYNVNASENKVEDSDTPKKDPFKTSTSAISEAASSSSLAASVSEAADADSTTAAATTTTVEDRYAVFLDIDSIPSIFDNPILVSATPEKNVSTLPLIQNSVFESEEVESESISVEEVDNVATSPTVAFAELDPLGNQPFVDKKDFFQDVKTPPKKVLKDLAGNNVFGSSDSEMFSNSHECLAAFNDLKSNQPEGFATFSDLIPNQPETFAAFSDLKPNQPEGFAAFSDLKPNQPESFAAFSDLKPNQPEGFAAFNDLKPNLPEGFAAFTDLKPNQPEAFAENMSTKPPKLPPKRNATSPFPVSSELFQESGSSSSDSTWEIKNPFNPFLNESFPDLPPPTSPPPPPPPPRLPIKATESSASLSPPPARPPASSINGVPTPPLPKRKVPLSSTNRTWFSFDQDAVVSFTSSSSDSSANQSAPPLPSPARKLPPISPLLKSSSASNSPATVRRLYNKSPFSETNLSPVIKENSDDYECLYLEEEVYKENRKYSQSKFSKMNIVTSSPRRVLSRHASLAQDDSAILGATFNPFQQSYISPLESHADTPPLPPKPTSFSQPKPSPVETLNSSVTSSNAPATESSNGAHSSSSLVFSSLDENKVGGSSSLFTYSPLISNGTSTSQPDVFVKSPEYVPLQSSNTTNEEKVDTSPDSIFRRRSDPFDDSFFLSLHKNPGDDVSQTGSTTKSSNRIDPFDNAKTST